MKKLQIKIISKDEFRKLLLECLLSDKTNWTVETTLDVMLDTGFPALDFERLDKCLPQMTTYLPLVAIEIGHPRFMWVVSGHNAMLVNKH